MVFIKLKVSKQALDIAAKLFFESIHCLCYKCRLFFDQQVVLVCQLSHSEEKLKAWRFAQYYISTYYTMQKIAQSITSIIKK